MSTNNKIIAGLDIGTTKICVIIAQQLINDQFEILGIGITQSNGLSKGVVVVPSSIYPLT
jgi:cell division protein FtsA